jgi:hypothetical protein
MPHRNRVTPYGEIVATPERGTLMGNRGVLHAADGARPGERVTVLTPAATVAAIRASYGPGLHPTAT